MQWARHEQEIRGGAAQIGHASLPVANIIAVPVNC
jgi:hypothetical protein